MLGNLVLAGLSSLACHVRSSPLVVTAVTASFVTRLVLSAPTSAAWSSLVKMIGHDGFGPGPSGWEHTTSRSIRPWAQRCMRWCTIIEVEVDVSGIKTNEDPFHTVGLPDAAVRESCDRVRAW